MPQVGAAIVAIGGSVGLSAAASMTVAIQLTVSTALSVAARYQRRKAMSKNAQDAGMRIPRKRQGGVNSRSFVLGTYSTAGSEVCPPMSRSEDGMKTPNAFMTQVLALSDLPVGGLKRLAINGEYVDVDWEDFGDKGYGYVVQGKYYGKCWITFHDGTQTKVDDVLLNKYADYPDRPWRAGMVGYGMSYASMSYQYDTEVYSGEPQAQFELQGIKLYDPRKDSTQGGSGSHRLANPATWEHTDNPIVMIYNILLGIPLRDGFVYGGMVEQRDLPIDNWVAAMNHCDELVNGKPRYRAGYEVLVAEDEPADLIDMLLMSCHGETVEVGGYWKVRVGGPGLPVGFYHQDDFLNSQPQEFDPFPPTASSHNMVNAVFPHPEELYASHDAPLYAPPEMFDALDPVERPLDLNFQAVPYPEQVQRLMRALLKEDQRYRVHSGTLGPYGFHLEPLDTIEFTSPRNGYQNKRFDIKQTTENLYTLCSALGFREVDPNDYDYDPNEDLPDPIVIPKWRLPTTQSSFGFGVTQHTQIDTTGKARAPAFMCYWDDTSLIDADALLIRYRLAGQSEELTKSVARPGIIAATVVSSGVRSNMLYEFSARPIAPGRRTDWTGWIPIMSPTVLFGREDIDLEAVKDEVRDDLSGYLGAIDETKEYTRDIRDTIGRLQKDVLDESFGNVLARQRVREEIAVETETSKAAFKEQTDLILTDLYSIAVRTSELRAQFRSTTALVRSEMLALAGPDSALAAKIDAVEVALYGAEGDASNAIITRIDNIDGELAVQSDNISTTSAAVQDAKTGLDRISADGLISIRSTAAPSGAATRIAIVAEAQEGQVQQQAGFWLEAGTDGTNQIVAAANRFALATGTGPAASRQIPFLVENGVTYLDKAIIKEADIDTLKIADGSVVLYWASNSEIVSLNLSYASRVLILTNSSVKGSSSGFAIQYKLFVDEVEQDATTFSVSDYTWNFTSFKVLNLSAGTHTIRHEYFENPHLVTNKRTAVWGAYR